MRRGLAVVFVALAAAGSANSSAPSPLSARLARALAVPHVVASSSAAIAFDLETGTAVFSRNDAIALAPASNEKLPVTYAALAGLGPDFRIETDVLGEGELVGTTWRGSLVLQGHGDPTLSRSDLTWLARQVRGSGIRRIAGAVVGDESYFDSRRTGPG